VALGLELRVDYLALSFVREAKDIRHFGAIIENSKASPKIIAKIEDSKALKNLQEIILDLITRGGGLVRQRGRLSRAIELPYRKLRLSKSESVISSRQRCAPAVTSRAHSSLRWRIAQPLSKRNDRESLPRALKSRDCAAHSNATSVASKVHGLACHWQKYAA